jgi:hypothetical protein
LSVHYLILISLHSKILVSAISQSCYFNLAGSEVNSANTFGGSALGLLLQPMATSFGRTNDPPESAHRLRTTAYRRLWITLVLFRLKVSACSFYRCVFHMHRALHNLLTCLSFSTCSYILFLLPSFSSFFVSFLLSSSSSPSSSSSYPYLLLPPPPSSPNRNQQHGRNTRPGSSAYST